MTEFVVGVGSDFYDSDGRTKLPALQPDFLDLPNDASTRVITIETRDGVCTPESLRGIDALVMSGGTIGAASLTGNDRLKLVARWGVGYDTVNLADCAAEGVIVTNAPEGVKRSMAHTAIGFVLALAHRMFDQDRAVRSGLDWSIKHRYIGTGLVGKTLGVIGLGNIGSQIVRVASVLDCTVIGHDPYVADDAVAVTRVDLDDLMRQSDFIIVQCALTPETRGMINRERLAMMKPTAYLVNTARGPIVDEVALIEALQKKTIAGAALDVFAREPTDPDNPLFGMDNVIVTPHSAGWTHDFALRTARSVSDSIRSVMAGEMPVNAVNRRDIEASGIRPRCMG